MEYFFAGIIFGIIPALIANNKGHSFGLWWIYGSLLFIVALVHSIVIDKNDASVEQRLRSNGYMKCPFCAEMIKDEAIKCKHCGSDIENDPIVTTDADSGSSLERPKEPFSFRYWTASMFIDRSGSNLAINKNAIRQFVYEARLANKGVNPSDILDVYPDGINDIKKGLPENLRGEFTIALDGEVHN